MNSNSRLIKPGLAVPFILVTLLFFFWGVANNLTDTLLAAFKNILSMSDFQTSFIQMAFYGSYACFALPAAFFIRRYSYKAGILLGLALYSLGTFLFFPAGLAGSYAFYLFAIYVLAGGCSILETTANPYILSMGDAKSATLRLNFAQAFNPIGAISGIVLSQVFILSQLSSNKSSMTAAELEVAQSSEMSTITLTYMGIGLLLVVLFLIIYFYKRMPDNKDTSNHSFWQMVSILMRKRHYLFGVIAQFFYIGAQIGVWSYTIRYAMFTLGMVDPVTDDIIPGSVQLFIENNSFWSSLWQLDAASTAENIGNTFYLSSLIIFMISRFIFTALMRFFSPGVLLSIASSGAIIASLVAIFASGMTGVMGLVMISFFMSLMFPTIYGIALYGLSGAEAKVGGSFLVMAILGGAVLTAIQGLLSTMSGKISLSYSIPVVCFVVVLIYGIYSSQNRELSTR